MGEVADVERVGGFNAEGRGFGGGGGLVEFGIKVAGEVESGARGANEAESKGRR